MKLHFPYRVILLLAAFLLLCGCQKETSDLSEDLSLSDVYIQETEGTDSPPETPEETLPPEETEVPETDEPEEPAEPEPIWQITLLDGTVDLYSEELALERGVQTVNRYVYSTGDTVEMGRVSADGGPVTVWTQQVGSGTMKCYDPETDTWSETALAAGEYRLNWAALSFADGSSTLVYLPKVYRDRGQSSLEYLPDFDGVLRVAADGAGFTLSLEVTLPEEAVVADYMTVTSPTALWDWADPEGETLWRDCLKESVGMWCVDGFYRATPEDYVPTGENYFYRCPATYLVKEILEIAEAGQYGAKILSVAMLDTVARQQNAYGFWETAPQSGWLSRDYGLAAGFYDTRFNTDLQELFLRCYHAFGGDRFLETLERYSDFFLWYSEKYHFETETGWFVEDYYHPDGGQPTHCSLNHQAAECSLLYDLADTLERPELQARADLMVNAIRDTGTAWVMDDSDLYYCIYPDGSYGRDDYPYLTYNDLLTLQGDLERQYGARDATIQAIMDAKKIWMDRNGVTGYWT